MIIREQLEHLLRIGVEFVVVGGQAGVLRQAIEFSHDLDVLIRPTPENAALVVEAVRVVTHVGTDAETVLSRDFQQYVDQDSGTELDVHLKLIAIPDFGSFSELASSDVTQAAPARRPMLVRGRRAS